MIHQNYILYFEEGECHEDNVDSIGKQVEQYFGQEEHEYWISMSMDSIDRNEWNNEESSDSDDSKLTVEFLESFLGRFIPESVGMNIMDSAKDIEP